MILLACLYRTGRRRGYEMAACGVPLDVTRITSSCCEPKADTEHGDGVAPEAKKSKLLDESSRLVQGK